jgi:hypothetical protein
MTARVAGLLYLVVVVCGIYSIAWVPSRIIDEDPARTVENLRNFELLFRTSIVAGVACYVAFLLLPLALYRVLADHGKDLGALMVAFAAVSVPISIYNLTNKIAVLSLIHQPSAAADIAARFQNYDRGILIATVFWGLWLLPLGWLIIRSRKLPVLLGVLLILGSAGYVGSFAGKIVHPDFRSLPFAGYLTLPATLGEIGTCLWLLIFGVRD